MTCGVFSYFFQVFTSYKVEAAFVFDRIRSLLNLILAGELDGGHGFLVDGRLDRVDHNLVFVRDGHLISGVHQKILL